MKTVFSIVLLLVAASAVGQPGLKNGEMRRAPQGALEAWHEPSQSWVTPQDFWRRYAEGRGGLTWGRGAEYPPYEEVKETDTFLVELESGTCLMLFWHTRWRRANDVRRWDERFNEVGGCPDVFK